MAMVSIFVYIPWIDLYKVCRQLIISNLKKYISEIISTFESNFEMVLCFCNAEVPYI